MRDCMQGMRQAGLMRWYVRRRLTNLYWPFVWHASTTAKFRRKWRCRCFRYFDGVVKHFPEIPHLKVPHMGWNQGSSSLIQIIRCGTTLNKTHVSILCIVIMLSQKIRLLRRQPCDYGVNFCTAIHKDNLFATQFHPEKSHTTGLQLLKTLWNGRFNIPIEQQQ